MFRLISINDLLIVNFRVVSDLGLGPSISEILQGRVDSSKKWVEFVGLMGQPTHPTGCLGLKLLAYFLFVFIKLGIFLTMAKITLMNYSLQPTG